MLVMGEEAGPDGFGRSVQWFATFFYSNESLLTSTRPYRLQADLDVLTGLFYRVVLQTNTNKKFGMVCQPYHIVVIHL